mmetsp:Transcript_14880/g.40765  ORF Transcript_14880/g.40765 Transcript_14880/m.40765 type:complete len:403 (-) Transcript_14880:1535-2743(-)
MLFRRTLCWVDSDAFCLSSSCNFSILIRISVTCASRLVECWTSYALYLTRRSSYSRRHWSALASNAHLSRAQSSSFFWCANAPCSRGNVFAFSTASSEEVAAKRSSNDLVAAPRRRFSSSKSPSCPSLATARCSRLISACNLNTCCCSASTRRCKSVFSERNDFVSFSRRTLSSSSSCRCNSPISRALRISAANRFTNSESSVCCPLCWLKKTRLSWYLWFSRRSSFVCFFSRSSSSLTTICSSSRSTFKRSTLPKSSMFCCRSSFISFLSSASLNLVSSRSFMSLECALAALRYLCCKSSLRCRSSARSRRSVASSSSLSRNFPSTSCRTKSTSASFFSSDDRSWMASERSCCTSADKTCSFWRTESASASDFADFSRSFPSSRCKFTIFSCRICKSRSCS